MRFRDRSEAGRLLAAELERYRDLEPVVVAMPRGGVPVGYEIARALDAPLDVIVVRKLGAPGHPELAVGAIVDGSEPEVVLNPDVVRALGVSAAYLRQEEARQLAVIHERQRLLRSGRPPVPLERRTAILVDDGIATGATARAAILGLRRRHPARVVLAVPVAPPDSCAALAPLVDDLVCLYQPEPFYAVGAWYVDFRQVSDEEVIELLERAHRERRTPPGR
ncbi:MAG: phosphoribosyltransferase [Planctomycetota bacterium]|nr:MAG: phosphoribosyltransferase [Planctomycetota bacterium]